MYTYNSKTQECRKAFTGQSLAVDVQLIVVMISPTWPDVVSARQRGETVTALCSLYEFTLRDSLFVTLATKTLQAMTSCEW